MKTVIMICTKRNEAREILAPNMNVKYNQEIAGSNDDGRDGSNGILL